MTPATTTSAPPAGYGVDPLESEGRPGGFIIMREMKWFTLKPPEPVSRGHLVQRYVLAVMQRAEVRELEDRTWYADVPEVSGPWGSGPTAADALEDLREVVEDWIELKIEDGDRDFPVLDEIDLNRLPQ